MHGRAGLALMFLRPLRADRRHALLDHAAWRCGRTCAAAPPRPDGHLEVNEGWRTMPYLAEGSVGIGLVLDQYLRHRDDEQFAEAAPAISRCRRLPVLRPVRAVHRPGRHLVYLAGRGATPDVAHRPGPAARLARAALRRRPAFPGNQLLRLSMDLPPARPASCPPSAQPDPPTRSGCRCSARPATPPRPTDGPPAPRGSPRGPPTRRL